MLGADQELTWEAEETKFIQESEERGLKRSDLEFMLALDEDSRDDEQANDASRTADVQHSAIDIWMEETSREMTLAPDKSNVDLLGALSYEATICETPETTMIVLKDSPQETMAFAENICHRCGQIEHVGQECNKDIIVLPKLGLFKRKHNFTPLATKKLITKMLSQSMFLLLCF